MSMETKEIEMVLSSIFGAELSALRGRYASFSLSDIDSSFYGAPYFIDSFEFLYLASYAANYFGLYENALEERLLRYKSIRSWAALIKEAPLKNIYFQTSGSTGKPKTITHSLQDLKLEAAYLASIFKNKKRVVSMAYSHHIYGFIFTALLPRYLDAETLSLSMLPTRRLEKLITKDDLVISTPYIYSNICGYDFEKGVSFVSSTSPLASDTYDSLTKNQNVVWEIYGSSETAGVGIRNSVCEPFSLFAYLEQIDGEVRKNGVSLNIQDKLEWVGERHFFPRGRVDKAVQVGGTNVFISALRERILSVFCDIEDISIRLDDKTGRLKGAIVAKKEFDEKIFFEWQAANLASPERLSDIKVLRSLPHRADGKSSDWEDFSPLKA